MTEEPVDRGDDEDEDEDEAEEEANEVIAIKLGEASRPGPTFSSVEPLANDLSSEIVKTLTKEPGERVTCRQITGNHYRCNWWSANDADDYDSPGMPGLAVTTHRVSRSEMLHVTRTHTGLTIKPAMVGKR